MVIRLVSVNPGVDALRKDGAEHKEPVLVFRLSDQLLQFQHDCRCPVYRVGPVHAAEKELRHHVDLQATRVVVDTVLPYRLLDRLVHHVASQGVVLVGVGIAQISQGALRILLWRRAQTVTDELYCLVWGRHAGRP
ncbi:hypothetical protein D3C78_1631630 [compost metagenome]